MEIKQAYNDVKDCIAKENRLDYFKMLEAYTVAGNPSNLVSCALEQKIFNSRAKMIIYKK